MIKWLRSWFAWQFSLTRLLIATVVLGAFVGLNMRTIGPWCEGSGPCCVGSGGCTTFATMDVVRYWGWPFPVHGQLERWKYDVTIRGERVEAAWTYQLPLTHQTYHLSRFSLLRDRAQESTFIVNAIIDVLFALTALLSILFLQIPHRRAPTPGSNSVTLS